MEYNELDLSEPEEVFPDIRKKNDFMQDVFDFLESINITKKNLINNEEGEARYQRCRWMVHRALSFSPDLVETVNLVNAMVDMSPRMEYEFFLNFIPVKVRRPKWHKKGPQSVYMNSVREYYGYNETKAEQAMKLLTIEQLDMIDKKIKKEDEEIWETFSGDGASK